jgi:hypothetical protein
MDRGRKSNFLDMFWFVLIICKIVSNQYKFSNTEQAQILTEISNKIAVIS